MGQTVVVPIGPNSSNLQVFDQNAADITGACQINAVSSDPSIIQIGTPRTSFPGRLYNPGRKRPSHIPLPVPAAL